jgi:hypothetical protein
MVQVALAQTSHPPMLSPRRLSRITMSSREDSAIWVSSIAALALTPTLSHRDGRG